MGVHVNGTLVWYYNICQREVWLMYRNIIPDQKDTNIDIGKFIHEESYKRNPKEITFGNVRFDILEKTKEGIVVGEIKKTSKYKEASKYQLLYYLNVLKQSGTNAKGVLLYPNEKKRENIELTSENINKLNDMIKEINNIAEAENAPKVKKINFCKHCAYREYCYS